jgi:hypothetical protein
LFSFNVGIEIGQIAFVMVVLAVHRLLLKPIDALPRWAQAVPVNAMGALAAMWVIERVVGLL